MSRSDYAIRWLMFALLASAIAWLFLVIAGLLTDNDWFRDRALAASCSLIAFVSGTLAMFFYLGAICRADVLFEHVKLRGFRYVFASVGLVVLMLAGAAPALLSGIVAERLRDH